MSGNIRVTWSWPNTRGGGVDLMPIDEIAHGRLEMQAQGAPGFTPVANVPPPDTDRLFENLPGGTYSFRLFVVDTNGAESEPATGSITIPVTDPTAPPDPATEFTLALEP